MAPRRLTPSYILFYVLFLPDTWQAAIGVLVSALLGSMIMPEQADTPARIMLFFMLAVIGYAASRPLGKVIAGWWKKAVLGDKVK